ncbi:DUF484 family protein [Alkalicaulis satelles]|uniref:DUF484 family protein n=1 Tax=Alkalicaulis satelles TaxID=2609175 RepID=A0A5M6ZIG8_9PROT|nr:DUF484 family protein [Alkalicaulis satelles]KAA5803497.1 DUF484 family protein [Alkalicaulis satelles]
MFETRPPQSPHPDPHAGEAGALDELRAWLRQHPEVIAGDPDLLARVHEAVSASGVVDLGAHARKRLDAELARARATNAALIALAKANLAAQAQTHAAILAVLEAESLSALDRKLSGRAAGALSVDIIRIFIEGADPLPGGQAIRACSPELTDALLGKRAERLGPVDERFASALYEARASGLRSEALVRLELARRPAVLCLAARDARAFTPDQGADLLHVFARVLERRITPWLAD